MVSISLADAKDPNKQIPLKEIEYPKTFMVRPWGSVVGIQCLALTSDFQVCSFGIKLILSQIAPNWLSYMHKANVSMSTHPLGSFFLVLMHSPLGED